MVAVPTLVMVPVVANETVSPFTSPVIVPAAVSGVPSYTLLAFGVVTVTVAGLTTISPVTLVILRLAVTSTPAAFTITSLSASAVTASVVTSVAVASDSAVCSVYPSGSSLTSTVAPCGCPSYVNVPPVVVTTISSSVSLTTSLPSDTSLIM